jgi:hypothetical protein
MKRNNSASNGLKPVSPETLKTFDALLASIEEDVLKKCLSSDNPEKTMGPEAKTIIKGGLGFISKLVRTTMIYDTGKIIADQLAWCQTCLPGYGVSMTMILNNFERYDRTLKDKLAAAAYEEIRPCLAKIIQQQRALMKEIDGKD